MQSELSVFVELADTWETIEGNSDQSAVYRECADSLRMMVDFKRKQVDTRLQPDRAPTHRCTICGAFWMKWRDSWSLCSKGCGQCCDNAVMGDQIVPLFVSDIYAPAAEITRLTEALRAAEEREKGLREEREELLSQISDCRGSHWLGRQDRKGVTPHLDAIWRGLVEIDDARAALKEQPHDDA